MYIAILYNCIYFLLFNKDILNPPPPKKKTYLLDQHLNLHSQCRSIVSHDILVIVWTSLTSL